jgi:hypothetical protein
MLYIHHKKISPFFLWNRKESRKASQARGTGPDSPGSILLLEIDSCLGLMCSPANGPRSQEDLWESCLAASRSLFLFASGGEIFAMIEQVLCCGLGDVNADSSNVYFRPVIKVLPRSFAVKETYIMLRICVESSASFQLASCCFRADQGKKEGKQDGSDPRPIGAARRAEVGSLPSCSCFLSRSFCGPRTHVFVCSDCP